MQPHLALLSAIVACATLSAPAQNQRSPIPAPDAAPRRERPAGMAGRPRVDTPGPWDHDVQVYRVSAEGQVRWLATFERAGVPTLGRLKDSRLLAAHQYFPADGEADFDKIAVRFSEDEGQSWTPPEVIHLTGLPSGMRFPFDPTLVPLPDGRVRLYFTSRLGRPLDEDVPAIFSAISTNGLDYVWEPGKRFGITNRMVIDCAVVLHDGVFHLYSPDNGLAPRRGEGPVRAEARPGAGVGYHATSADGLNFTRTDDVRIAGQRHWLGNAQSDGQRITFFGTGDSGPPGPDSPLTRRGGVWMATSRDGQTWQPLATPPIPGADPGAVAARDGGWIVAATGPPRPGTPSAERFRMERPGQGGFVPDGLPPPNGTRQNPPLFERAEPGPSRRSGEFAGPMPGGDPGPRTHRILLASSQDGLNWTVASESLAEQASVPELFEGPDGRLIALFVDASATASRGVLGALVRLDDGRWVRRQTNLRGADPNVVRLADGTYRGYTKEFDGAIIVFASRDGLQWERLGEAFRDERYHQATDADVFETPAGWVMLLSLGPRLLRAISPDGLKFTPDVVIELGGSVSDTVQVQGGWRTFFHVNANPRTGGKMLIRSAFTADGKTWQVEPGDRVVAPDEGPAQLGVADPAPVRLKDGSWLMLLKSFINPPGNRSRFSPAAGPGPAVPDSGFVPPPEAFNQRDGLAPIEPRRNIPRPDGLQPQSEIHATETGSQYAIAPPGKPGYFVTGQNADLVLGAKGFNFTGGPLLFNHPTGLATDGQGLLLSDRWNNRVLIFQQFARRNEKPLKRLTVPTASFHRAKATVLM